MLRTVFFTVSLILSNQLFAQDWASWIDAYGPGVAKIELKIGGVLQGSGSGFAIASDRLLTGAHVVTTAQFDSKVEIQLTFPLSSDPHKVHVAHIEQISDELDLAILKTDITFAKWAPFASEDLPRMMSEVLVLGFPLGLNFKATPGFVQAFQDVPEQGTMLDLSASVDPGNSGGPVLTRDGKVVGIVISRIVGRNFNLALPIRNAAEYIELSKNPIRFQVATQPTGARVFANGLFKGTSPLQITLLNRRVELAVEKDGFEPSKRTVAAENNAIADQAFELTATATTTTHVKLVVNAPGARVWINNSDKGKAPLEWDADKGTRLRLRIEAPGYTTLTTTVDLTNENDQTIQLTLQKGWF